MRNQREKQDMLKLNQCCGFGFRYGTFFAIFWIRLRIRDRFQTFDIKISTTFVNLRFKMVLFVINNIHIS
jgi:hypothetical protein